ncbi:MAG: hypothetical protein LBQ76_09645 [Candidatus Fibromonas sp.]|jgi:hypothetical protein|nr:hypothetical protein [Candidatus Fibromonas sp.]
MKFSRLIALLLFAASLTLAVERIGVPVSPSLWDSYLPNPTHPSYASNLGALQEGRLTFGFQNADLAHLSLSVPGLQIISANTKWRVKPGQERWFYDSKHAYLAENGYYRDLFLVAGGGRLSNILSLKSWDIGIGGTFKSLAVEDEDELRIWRDNWLGLSFSLSVNSILVSGSWDKYEQRYLLAYNEPGSKQAGIEFYQNLEDLSSFGVQPGVEGIFYESFKFHGGMRWQFAESTVNSVEKRVEFMLNFGLSLKFRPWRAGTDPGWVHPIISPFNATVLYDWEFSFDSNIDTEYKVYYWLISVSKWF